MDVCAQVFVSTVVTLLYVCCCVFDCVMFVMSLWLVFNAPQVLGAGILTLPYTLHLSGIGWGLLLLFVTYVGSLFCSKLLLECAEATNTHHYETLATAVFPKYGATMVSTCLILGNECGYINVLYCCALSICLVLSQ